MRLLALDTSSRQFSIALWEIGKTTLERKSSPETASSRLLIPAVRELLDEVAWDWADIDAIGLARGPGSFSGLRIGATLAKTLGYALNKPLVGVNTLEAIAFQARQSSKFKPGRRIAALLDAQRNQLFVQEFCGDNGDGIVPLSVRQLVDLTKAPSLLVESLVTGPGAKLLQMKAPAAIGLDCVEAELWDSTASSIACLATSKYRSGLVEDCWSLQLDYGRPSAAEENIKRDLVR